MSEEIQWDSSLVRKFGSFNHSKLLTQLKTEVKAYPLKRRSTNTSSFNRKNTNNSNQSSSSNLEENILSTIEDRSMNINNQQHQSVIKSNYNSFYNSNSSSNDLGKGYIANQFKINPNKNSESVEKQSNIYNNNDKSNTEMKKFEFNNINSKVSFKETELID